MRASTITVTVATGSKILRLVTLISSITLWYFIDPIRCRAVGVRRERGARARA